MIGIHRTGIPTCPHQDLSSISQDPLQNEEDQTIKTECIFNESIQLRLLVSSRQMIFKGNFILEYLGTFGAVITSGHDVLGLDMAPNVLGMS